MLAVGLLKRGFDVQVLERDVTAIRGEGKYRGPIQVTILPELTHDMASARIDLRQVRCRHMAFHLQPTRLKTQAHLQTCKFTALQAT